MAGYGEHTTPFPQDPATNPNVVLSDVPCDITVYVGAVVRMTGAGIAVNAIADSLANSNLIGVVQRKPTPTTCDIRVTGITDPNTIFAGLDPTKEYFLSDITAGLITTIAPTAAGHIVVRVGQPFSATELFVAKGIRIERA